MASKEVAKQLSLADLTVVDADSHNLPSMTDDVLPYFDDHSGAKRMIENASHVKSEIYSNTRASPSFPNHDGSSAKRAGYLANDPESKLGFMREFGIDYSVIVPSGTFGSATINHDPTAVEVAHAYNSYLLDNWLDVDDRLYATMLVANQIPERAPEEIDRMANEPQVAGVQLPAAGLVPPAGHRQYNPIYEAAESHGLPIVMHSHDFQGTFSFPVQRRWAETFTESHAFMFPVESMWHLISLIFQGVPERFPGLNFVMQEPGFEWVPWMMWRLDDHYLQCSDDLPMLEKPPSEYIRDQFYFTTQPLGHTTNPQYLGWMMEMAGGSDTLLFSTDHAHADFDTPEEVFGPAKTQLDEDNLRGLMGETALEVFGLR